MAPAKMKKLEPARFPEFDHLKPHDKPLSEKATLWIQEHIGAKPYNIRKVKNYSELEELIAPLRDDSNGLVFRGHASRRWKLSSKYERALSSKEQTEQGASFRWADQPPHGPALNIAKHLLGIRGDNSYDGQLLAELQHYGDSTSLLDWTESIDIALFFAFQFSPDPHTKYAAIFVANPANINRWTEECGKPWNSWKFYTPTSFYDARVHAQQGLFMLHGFHPSPLEVGIQRLEGCADSSLLKIAIPRNLHSQVAHELKIRKIEWNKLFPRSMEDICREVEQRMLKQLYEPSEL